MVTSADLKKAVPVSECLRIVSHFIRASRFGLHCSHPLGEEEKEGQAETAAGADDAGATPAGRPGGPVLPGADGSGPERSPDLPRAAPSPPLQSALSHRPRKACQAALCRWVSEAPVLLGVASHS